MAPNNTDAPAGDDFATRVMARLKPWAAQAARFGSAGNMVVAACVAVVTCAVALASAPLPSQATVIPAATHAPAPRHAPLTDISAPGFVAPDPSAPADEAGLAPIGAPPGAAVQTALDYDVVFFWPATPQTVAEPVAIRDGPASYAKVIRSARPGERLRINGKVADAPNGPWLRVRLADGQDGYFAARTLDVGAFRHRRAMAAAGEADATPGEVTAAGAPLIAAAPQAPPEEIGPPAF